MDECEDFIEITSIYTEIVTDTNRENTYICTSFCSAPYIYLSI